MDLGEFSGNATKDQKEFNSNHAMVILRKLNLDRKSTKNYCDITIESGDQKFPAHKCVLGSFSDFYEKMFTSEMQEKYKKYVNVEGVSAKIMDLIMEFIYSCNIIVTHDNVFDLLAAADFMQIPYIKEYCRIFLMEHVTCTLGNCFKLRTCAKTYDLKELCEKADETIAEKFYLLVAGEQFKLLNFEDACSVMQVKNKTVSSEDVVYDAVISWVKHDITGRQEYFDQLFSFVKLRNLSRKLLEDVVFSEELVRNSDTATDLLIKSMATHVPDVLDNDSCTSLVIMGGEGSMNEADQYSVAERRWIGMPDASKYLRNARVGATAVNYNNHIYLIGGQQTVRSIDMLCVDDTSDKWQQAFETIHQQSFSASVVLNNNCIYCCGGVDDTGDALKSCVPYDPLCRASFMLENNMNQRRSHHGCVVFNNNIYAIGGKSDTKDLNSVECLISNSAQWMYVSPMNITRSSLCTVILNEEIYAIGGQKDGKSLSSVERYSPLVNSWISAAALVVKRHAACACVANGKIYVIGGMNEEGDVLSVEVYDPSKYEWVIESLLEKKKVYSSLVAI